MVLGTLTISQKGVDNHLSVSLKTLVLHAAQKAVYPPEFLSRFSDAFLDSSVFITLVAVLFKSEQQKLATKQVKTEDRCRQLVEMLTKMNSRQVSVASDGNDLLPTDIFD